MKVLRPVLTYVTRLIRSRRVFYFLFGLLLGFSLYFYTEDQYEKQLFAALADNIRIPGSQTETPESTVVRSMHLVHALEQGRQTAFSYMKTGGFKAGLLQPITYDLMTGKGACGSNSLVLSRLLVEIGFPVRIAQMTVDGQKGGHIVVETKVDQQWIVLDPLYDLAFTDKRGHLAGFDEIRKEWEFYKGQVPIDYDPRYNYAGVQYTNWSKIPLLPTLHGVLAAVKGKDWADHLSLRILMIRKFRVFFILSLVALAILTLIRIRITRSPARKRDIPSGRILQVA